MKANLFLSALTLGAMMTTFVACDKEEPYVDPGKVIESEVVDPGMAEDVQVTDNGTEGTSLSYETWIVVHQVFADGSSSGPQTRAGESGTKISVILENKLTNVSSTADVSGFELKEPENSVDYRSLGSAKYATEPFVTVIDSATVYTVDYGTFAVEFVLPYQVAVYDDGVTKVTMPYHKYADIKDNGGELSDLESVTENGITYLRKLYKHSLTANFNGEEYLVTAEIVLRKEQKGDYLVAQKVVDEGVELVSYDLENKTGVSRSWIKVEETWSESGVKTVTKEVLLNNGPSDGNFASFVLYITEKCNFGDLVIGDAKTFVSEDGSRTENGIVIKKYRQTISFPVTYPAEDATTEFAFGITFEEAVYSNEGFEYKMPSFEYTEPTLSMSQTSEWYVSAEGQGVMDISLSSQVRYDRVVYTYVDAGQIICFR